MVKIIFRKYFLKSPIDIYYVRFFLKNKYFFRNFDQSSKKLEILKISKNLSYFDVLIKNSSLGK